MSKTKLTSKIIALSMLSCALTALGAQIVQAQQQRLHPTSLLRAKCVDSGDGSARESEDLNVSIGKAVYSSQFYLGPGNRSASLTCKIQPDRSPEPIFQTLNLGFGMRDMDRNSPGVTVNVYLDGRQYESRTVRPADRASLTMDVGNVSNVSIEAVCNTQSQYCDRVYFYEAMLVPKAPVPKMRTFNFKK